MQAKADAHRQGARDDGELVETEAHVAKAHGGGDDEADIAHARADGVAQARIQLGARQQGGFQPMLEAARERKADGEEQHGDDDARKGDRHVPHFEAEEGGADAGEHVVGFDAPGRQRQQDGGGDEPKLGRARQHHRPLVKGLAAQTKAGHQRPAHAGLGLQALPDGFARQSQQQIEPAADEGDPDDLFDQKGREGHIADQRRQYDGRHAGPDGQPHGPIPVALRRQFRAKAGVLLIGLRGDALQAHGEHARHHETRQTAQRHRQGEARTDHLDHGLHHLCG